MRLWSLHPKHLDEKSLYLLWEDCLAAVALLSVTTPPGKPHPALIRFQMQPQPLQAISDYMHSIADEAQRRDYLGFPRSAIPELRGNTEMTVTAGQMEHEAWLFGAVLVKGRGGGEKFVKFWSIDPDPHPVFCLISGAMEFWEKLPPYDYAICKTCGDPAPTNGRGKPRQQCYVCRPIEKKVNNGV